jgi:hypothetical protein
MMKSSTHGACLLSSAAILSVVSFAQALAAAAHHVDVSALTRHAGPRPMAFLATIAALALSAGPMLWLVMSDIRSRRVRLPALGIAAVVACLLAGWTFIATCASLGMSGLLWWQRNRSNAAKNHVPFSKD